MEVTKRITKQRQDVEKWPGPYEGWDSAACASKSGNLTPANRPTPWF